MRDSPETPIFVLAQTTSAFGPSKESENSSTTTDKIYRPIEYSIVLETTATATCKDPVRMILAWSGVEYTQ